MAQPTPVPVPEPIRTYAQLARALAAADCPDITIRRTGYGQEIRVAYRADVYRTEYPASFKQRDARAEQGAAYTTDAADAYATAQAMQAWIRKTRRP